MQINIKYNVGIATLAMVLSFSTIQHALSGDFFEEINVADHKVILGQYEDAREIYQKIIRSADSSISAAYAHYKLGTLYKRQNNTEKAKEEYAKGLKSLKGAGKSNHQIGKYLDRALQVIG